MQWIVQWRHVLPLRHGKSFAVSCWGVLLCWILCGDSVPCGSFQVAAIDTATHSLLLSGCMSSGPHDGPPSRSSSVITWRFPLNCRPALVQFLALLFCDSLFPVLRGLPHARPVMRAGTVGPRVSGHRCAVETVIRDSTVSQAPPTPLHLCAPRATRVLQGSRFPLHVVPAASAVLARRRVRRVLVVVTGRSRGLPQRRARESVLQGTRVWVAARRPTLGPPSAGLVGTAGLGLRHVLTALLGTLGPQLP